MKIFRLLSLLSLVFFSTCAAMKVEEEKKEETDIKTQLIEITEQNFTEARPVFDDYLKPIYLAAFLPLEKASSNASIEVATSELEKTWQSNIGSLFEDEYPAPCRFMITYNSKEAIGFAQIRVKSPKKYFSSLREEAKEDDIKNLKVLSAFKKSKKQGIYIENIAIAPKFNHKGIGTLMMNEIQKTPAEFIYLDVATRNIPAIQFYKKLGFKKVGSYAVDGGDDFCIYAKLNR
ncbi:MAG: N-acetyltransferase [Candidatus Babeliales bacterium]|jgi:ribosomal protein S18 acetylase RimI-like enzyme